MCWSCCNYCRCTQSIFAVFHRLHLSEVLAVKIQALTKPCVLKSPEISFVKATLFSGGNRKNKMMASVATGCFLLLLFFHLLFGFNAHVFAPAQVKTLRVRWKGNISKRMKEWFRNLKSYVKATQPINQSSSQYFKDVLSKQHLFRISVQIKHQLKVNRALWEAQTISSVEQDAARLRKLYHV